MSTTTGSDAVLVLTTLGAAADAVGLARRLVEERLAACVNVLPEMTSIYRWQGIVQQDREQQLLIKTTVGRIEALAARLRELHPYDVPEFLVFRADEGADGYLGWVRESVTAD